MQTLHHPILLDGLILRDQRRNQDGASRSAETLERSSLLPFGIQSHLPYEYMRFVAFSMNDLRTPTASVGWKTLLRSLEKLRAKTVRREMPAAQANEKQEP